MVKTHHQTPTSSRTNRSGSVGVDLDIDVFDSVKRSKILNICTNTAAQ
jgi:hypothetical protein